MRINPKLANLQWWVMPDLMALLLSSKPRVTPMK